MDLPSAVNPRVRFASPLPPSGAAPAAVVFRVADASPEPPLGDRPMAVASTARLHWPDPPRGHRPTPVAENEALDSPLPPEEVNSANVTLAVPNETLIVLVWVGIPDVVVPLSHRPKFSELQPLDLLVYPVNALSRRSSVELSLKHVEYPTCQDEDASPLWPGSVTVVPLPLSLCGLLAPVAPRYTAIETWL